MKLYLVGGAVRDHFLRPAHSKDFDFAVEAPSYEVMYEDLKQRGLYVWQERPQYVTVRGRLTHQWFGAFGGLIHPNRDGSIDADFTLCRRDGNYSDYRHPDTVEVGSLADDLARRDFTMNAIAVSEDGTWHDPWDGRRDIERRRLTAVGLPMSRLTEDPLRVLRAIRFSVTRGLTFDYMLESAMHQSALMGLLSTLPVERVREELRRAFAHSCWQTMDVLNHFRGISRVLEREFPNLWFKPTTESR